MSGKLLVGIAIGAMIMGPYRITADVKKPESTDAKKISAKPSRAISISESAQLRNKQLRHKSEK